jgi:hypothetical protein
MKYVLLAGVLPHEVEWLQESRRRTQRGARRDLLKWIRGYRGKCWGLICVPYVADGELRFHVLEQVCVRGGFAHEALASEVLKRVL